MLLDVSVSREEEDEVYKKKKEDEVFLVLLGHSPRPSVRRVRGSLLPSFDPHQRCRLDDCREQSVCPTVEDLVPPLRLSSFYGTPEKKKVKGGWRQATPPIAQRPSPTHMVLLLLR